ncbi:alpha/beta hydrolase [Demequina capsici]|uniref:Alpha/beta hydrolase-fold protein n=1 Tax=Demequina capsici TaxID=3075620 RepID=A0AA96F9W0_9MICO|nr:alpha/beta hydrolase-fold protein [Demequina sp. OYTSA14]WNM25838.1 alpha/beta hydrolase-fold protein [Demequina sp. OYTSA14]
MTALMSITSPTWPAPDSPSRRPLLLLLHGYGADERDLAGLAPLLPIGVPWASVRAPLEMGFGGAAWFPLSPPTLDYSADAVRAATGDLWRWIDDHAPADAPLVPIGFSQGGLMALQLLRTLPERIVGTVVLSGFVADVPVADDARLAEARPRVLWVRGDADAVIPPAQVARMERWLPMHASPSMRVHPGLGHGIDERVMADVVEFLEEIGVGTGA